MLAFAAVGCLEPNAPSLAAKDEEPPVVTATVPSFDGGVAQTIGRDTELSITFSEPMDPRSIRPGVNVIRGRDSVALVVAADRIYSDAGEQVVQNGEYNVTAKPEILPLADGGVDPNGGRWAANAQYTLILRTLLTDTEGNALAEEIRVPFRTGP